MQCFVSVTESCRILMITDKKWKSKHAKIRKKKKKVVQLVFFFFIYLFIYLFLALYFSRIRYQHSRAPKSQLCILCILIIRIFC